MLCRYSNDQHLKLYYKRYCKVLSNIIMLAKKLYYNKIILNSKNKTATTWKIIYYEKGKTTLCKNIVNLRIENANVTDQTTIANFFNSYFLSITDSINMGNNNHTRNKIPNPISYLINNLQQTYPNMTWQNATTQKLLRSLNL